jgi:hypothetical protein
MFKVNDKVAMIAVSDDEPDYVAAIFSLTEVYHPKAVESSAEGIPWIDSEGDLLIGVRDGNKMYFNPKTGGQVGSLFPCKIVPYTEELARKCARHSELKHLGHIEWEMYSDDDLNRVISLLAESKQLEDPDYADFEG